MSQTTSCNPLCVEFRRTCACACNNIITMLKNAFKHQNSHAEIRRPSMRPASKIGFEDQELWNFVQHPSSFRGVLDGHGT